MEEYDNIKKFPIGISNKQCIGPCYPPKSLIMHPISLATITNESRPFCPTNEWFNEKTNKMEMTDICLIPSKMEEISKQQIELNFILPTFYFNCEYFLRTYYDIFSFESAIEWIIGNNTTPIYSQLRILDCAWKIYGSTIDVLNEQLIEIYINIIKKEWIKDIYPIFSKNIEVNGENIVLTNNAINSNDNNKIEKINFFISKFINKQTIYKILYDHISNYKSDWHNIKSHNFLIKENLINYINDKLKNL